MQAVGEHDPSVTERAEHVKLRDSVHDEPQVLVSRSSDAEVGRYRNETVYASRCAPRRECCIPPDATRILKSGNVKVIRLVSSEYQLLAGLLSSEMQGARLLRRRFNTTLISDTQAWRKYHDSTHKPLHLRPPPSTSCYDTLYRCTTTPDRSSRIPRLTSIDSTWPRPVRNADSNLSLMFPCLEGLYVHESRCPPGRTHEQEDEYTRNTTWRRKCRRKCRQP